MMSNNKGLVKFTALLVLTLVLCVANLSCAVVRLGPEGEFKGIDIALNTGGQISTIDSFDASPLSISPGESSTIQWSVSGATDIVLDQGIGSVSPTGNVAVSPTATTVYTITATNSAGSVTKSVTVAVATAAAPPTPTPSPTPFSPAPPSLTPPSLTPPSLPLILSLTADPASISVGGNSRVSWSVSGATSITIVPGGGSVPASGSAIASPPSTTTYTLMATNAAGTVTRQVTVMVAAAAPPPPTPPPSTLPVVVSFTASPTSISAGGNSILNWNITGVSSVTIAPGGGALPPSGNATTSPAATTTYTLTATNTAGTVTRPVTVTVAAAPPPPTPPPPSGDAATCEQALFNAVNALRASNGKAALTRNAYIDGLCRQHAQYMASAGTLSHDNSSARCNGIYANISGMHACAENVLQSNLPCDANDMAQMWFTSPGHNANMLNAAYTISGMGIVIDGSGKIWACQMFTGP